MPQKQYAAGTTVGIGQSQEEIKRELISLGATKRLIHEDDERHLAVLMFERAGVQYRITLPLLNPADRAFRYTPLRGLARTQAQARDAWLQDCKERWRALAAHVKALRVATEAGITTVERVLLPFAIVPDSGGRTVEEWMGEQLPQAYATGHMPPLLPGATPRLIQAPSTVDA